MPTYYGFILVKKVNGTVTGRYPVTKKECTFGRDSKNDIRILLESVSAQHCIIICVDDKVNMKYNFLIIIWKIINLIFNF